MRIALAWRKLEDMAVVEQNKKYVTLGKSSRLYPDTKIDNMQQNPSKIVVGDGTHIRGILLVRPYGDGIRIGSNCYIGDHSRIWAFASVKIGDSVLISHNVTVIDSDSHELDYLEREKSVIQNFASVSPMLGNVETAPIVIEDHVWISYNACILKGVTIGKGAIVGAGSVVTKDVPPWTVVAGNPAKVIRRLQGGSNETL
jgi:acetyltransferase-like isoleucine patch superfamily enzyme